MNSWKQDEGGIVAGLLVICLVLGVLALAAVYFGGTREIDASAASAELAKGGEAVARDLGRTVDRIQEESSDALTTAKVKTALALSKTVSAFDLDVDTEDRRVRLTGSVPTREVESAAMRIAGDVSGVREVIDAIRVSPDAVALSSPDDVSIRLEDAELKAAVYESLLDDERVDARRMRVLVARGNVTLVGVARTPEERELAVAAAEGVPGVQSVVDELRVTAVSAS